MSISQAFEELQGWNSELKLITPISITGSHFGTMAAILDFFCFGIFWGGGGRGGRRPPAGPEGPRGPEGPPALRRSEKEGGRRPPEPSRTDKKLIISNRSEILGKSELFALLNILYNVIHNCRKLVEITQRSLRSQYYARWLYTAANVEFPPVLVT